MTRLSRSTPATAVHTLSLVDLAVRHKYSSVESSTIRVAFSGQGKSAVTLQIEKWLSQAGEARALASAFQSIEARRQMLSIASAYERLAQFARDRDRQGAAPD